MLTKAGGMAMQMTLPADSDGFVAFECPHSGDRFKLAGSEYKDRSVSSLYCPICGLSDEPSRFITRDALEVAKVMAVNAARDMIARELRSIGRGSRGGFRLRLTPSAPEPVPDLHEPTDMVIADLPCCGARVKVTIPSAVGVLYCPYCGTLND
jgi:hypothetical protein